MSNAEIITSATAGIITSPPSSSIELSSLDGSTGFRLDGVSAGNKSGSRVSSAGDINGDGFDDLIIGAYYADTSYVVFGQAATFSSTMALASLDGSTGFRMDSVAASDWIGYSVNSAGDVNGDGFDDLIIGAVNASNSATTSGSGYVVFGTSTSFGSAFDLATLDGSTGFRIDGAAAGDYAGVSVDSAGDINGDGFDDLIIGADYSDYDAAESGSSYVVFGQATGFAAVLDLTSLNGSTGFRLDGVATLDYSGHSVSSAGDINGDGFDDVIVGAWKANSSAGTSYVVFGQSSSFAASVDLSSLDGTTGFRLEGITGGDQSGVYVSSAGDINGDGIGDIIIGANGTNTGAGSSYVVFGQTSSFSSTIDLASLDGSTGFLLDGETTSKTGYSVSSAGDVNGDGFDDLIIGAYNANTATGTSYVMFGHSTSFSSQLDLSSLDGYTGFSLEGVQTGDKSGYSVSSAGDVNGDGFDDLIVGASGTNSNTGSSYVVFGSNSTGAVTFLGSSAADTLDGGSSSAESFVSAGGNDTLTGGGGADVFHAGEGDDTISISDTTFQLIDGGSGSDTLTLAGTGISLNLTTERGSIESIETINITGSGDNNLTLTALDLLNLSDSSNTLTVEGDSGDTVYRGSGWTDAGVSGGYQVYTQGEATLNIATAITNKVTAVTSVGYYHTYQEIGVTSQADVITLAGYTPVDITTPDATELANVQVLFVENDSGGFAGEWSTYLSDITTAVNNGMTLIVHDWTITGTEAYLPGGSGITFTNDAADQIDVVSGAPTTFVSGVGGTLTDTTLDFGGYARHGYATDTTLPTGAVSLLNSSDTTQVVAFSYPLGAGEVIYAGIPLTAHIGSENDFKNIYAPNIISYGASLVDPIVIDLDGNGIRMVTSLTASLNFSMSPDGQLRPNTWLDAGDGFLVLDKNSNDQVDDISEMFSEYFAEGQSTGLGALSTLDSNLDRIIDSQDSVYGQLAIWQDSNADGVTDAGEMQSLAAWGIAAIDLDATQSYETIGAGTILSQGTVLYEDGHEGQFSEIGIRAHHSSASEEAEPVNLDAAADTTETIQGGDGDDILYWDGAGLKVDGGAGTDTLMLQEGTHALDLTNLDQDSIRGIEKIDLSGSGDNTLALDINDLLDISHDNNNQLIVDGDAGDQVNAQQAMDWVLQADSDVEVDGGRAIETSDEHGHVEVGDSSYVVYSDLNNQHTLLVDTDIVLNFVS